MYMSNDLRWEQLQTQHNIITSIYSIKMNSTQTDSQTKKNFIQIQKHDQHYYRSILISKFSHIRSYLSPNEYPIKFRSSVPVHIYIESTYSRLQLTSTHTISGFYCRWLLIFFMNTVPEPYVYSSIRINYDAAYYLLYFYHCYHYNYYHNTMIHVCTQRVSTYVFFYNKTVTKFDFSNFCC